MISGGCCYDGRERAADQSRRMTFFPARVDHSAAGTAVLPIGERWGH